MKPIADIDPAFGHWLAGFTDGEGCFDIHPIRSTTHDLVSYICRFAIGLRADDVGILRHIQETLGVGTIAIRPGGGGKASPQARWSVERKVEAAYMAEFFKTYPLRAKKRDDLVLWTEAVMQWHNVRTNRRRHDWTAMELLREQLCHGRTYEPVELPKPDPAQLRIVI